MLMDSRDGKDCSTSTKPSSDTAPLPAASSARALWDGAVSQGGAKGRLELQEGPARGPWEDGGAGLCAETTSVSDDLAVDDLRGLALSGS